MSIQWRDAIQSGLLMFVVYVGLELVAIRLGWLTRIGWIGAVVATIVVAWLGYRRSAGHVARSR